ncbi:Protein DETOXIFICATION 51, partial [Ancistrocladus abbreviatus]
ATSHHDHHPTTTMCNPKNPKPTISATEKQSQYPQTHFYFDLLSLPRTITNFEEPPNNLTLSTPAVTEIFKEIKFLISLAFPILLTSLILFSRSIISMLFLGHLGDVELAAGSLAIAFANITGYSVLSGLALGMEPLCSQAFGANRPKLLSLTLHRSILFLLTSSLPISLLWLNMPKIFLYLLHQDHSITRLAHTYLLFSLPDLVTNSFVHPIRIYLRAQGITHPLTLASLAATALHVPISFFLVGHLQLGVAGVAAASAVSNVLSLAFLISHVWIAGLHLPTWTKPTRECFTGWEPLVRLAAPSCASVCLEWWWYEIMIVLCGLLADPKATVASMGVLIQTTGLIYNFPSSLSFAVSTRVGNELGANRPHKARLSAFVSIIVSAVMGLTAMLFATSLRYRWARMYTGDPEILKLTAAALPILGLCELGNCPQTVGCGVVRGSARPTTAANVNLGAFYLVGAPVAVGLAFYIGLGFPGIWIGLLSAQICCAGLMLYVVGTTDWECQAMRAQTLTCTEGLDRLLLPNDSGDEDDQEKIQKEPLIRIVVTSS